MSERKKLKQYVKALEHMLEYFNSELEKENEVTEAPYSETDRLREITDLRSLVRSSKWPEAIESDLISDPNSKEDKISRAYGILNDFVKEKLTGKTFLDIGCDDGYVVHIASKTAQKAVGYDITQKWEQFDNVQLTTNWKEIEGKFDVILINDVLDHATDPIELLRIAKNFKSETGKIYVRCHPWTSRHGTHLYRQLNKAYLQLVFTEQELYGLGLFEEKVTKLIDPMTIYQKWFEEAKLQISKKSTIKQEVDYFFIDEPVLLRRIKEKFGTETFPHEILEIQFADFVLV